MNLLFIIALLLMTLSATAQNAVQFTSDEGLSSSCVRRIYEDSRHNVWVCTRNGLNRYDGAKMSVYHHDASNPNSLGHDIVTYILEMDADHIIVGLENGIQSYSYATNSFTEIPMITSEGDTMRTHTIGLYRFLNGDIHVCATANGSYVIRKNANGELWAEHTDVFSHNGIRPGMLLNTSGDEVWTVDADGHVTRFNGTKATVIEGVSGVNRLVQGNDGAIYASTVNDGIYKAATSKSNRMEKLHLPGVEGLVIKSIRSDSNGHLMICSDGNGLLRFDEATQDVRPSVVRAQGFNLAGSNVEDAMYDSEGNLWVGVYWKGVVVVPKQPSTFEYVGHRSTLKNTIGNSSVTSVLPSRNGGVWVAADHDGLYKISDDGTQSLHIAAPATPKNETPEGSNANQKAGGLTISTMLEASDGTLWLGSSIGGIMLMDSKQQQGKGVLVPFASICPQATSVRLVYDIHEDEQHFIWIASMGNGLFCYNPADHSLVSYTQTSDNQNANAVTVPWVSCVATNKGKVYVGSASGLYIYDIQADGTLRHNSTPLSSMTVNCIRIADDGTVWVASSRGVHSLSPKGEITSITVADGLPDNHVCSIELEKRSKDIIIWAATDHGLCRYAPNAPNGELASSFFVSDGLQGNEFCNGVSAQRDGVLYFGGINGLNYFNPSNIDQSYAARSLDFRIVGFYIFGSPAYAGDKSGSYEVMNTWVAEAEELHVCHSDNTFSLELAPLNLLANLSSYEYSVNGDEWISLGEGQNRISFTNMSPGTYSVRIRAVGYNQKSAERSIAIIVHPAWYASTWAYIIYIVLLLLVVYAIAQQVKERVAARRVLQRHRQEEELNEARIQFFMNISHEIRTPMTLILAPLEKLRAMDTDDEHQRNYKLIHQNAHRILRLINQLMDVRKIEKGQFQLDYKQIDVVEFIQSLFDVYETSARNRRIDFRFTHAGIERLDAMVDPSSLDKIVMNLLSNAFKFTPDDGNITISLAAHNEQFEIIVTDSGMGIADDEKQKVFRRFYSSKHQNGYIGTGIGLNLTALLVELHQGEIEVEDNPDGQGAQFVVKLPMKHETTAAKAASQDDLSTDLKDFNTPEVLNTPNASNALRDSLEPDAPLLTAKSTAIRHRNLLVVEDDAAIRQYIHSELASDFTIHECSNGMEGWEYVQKNPDKVDMIISDIMMPVMEGTTLCQKVKSNFTTNHIPVILMSAKTTEADRIAGMSIGADAYVTKPFNLELLRTTAINILKQRQMLRGKFTTATQTQSKIEQIELTSPDEHLMERVMKVINANMDNPDLSVEFVADKVGVSRVHFHRKLKELTGQTPRDFIKSIRLKEAARLLSEKHLDITDVSIATGFKSLSTFSTSFKQVYGQTPTEYMKERLGQ